MPPYRGVQETQEFARYIGRRGPKEQWATRCVCALLCALVLLPAVLLWTGYGSERFFTHDSEGRRENHAARDLRGKTLGLPFTWGNVTDVFGNVIPLHPPETNIDDEDLEHVTFSDTSFAMMGAEMAATIASETCQAMPPVSLKVVCTAWVDAGLLFHYATKGNTDLRRPTSPLAVGMQKEAAEWTKAHIQKFAGKVDYISPGACTVVMTPPEAAVPPDAGWYYVCNGEFVIRVLAYEEYNETHLALPWPEGYRRCLSCASDALVIRREFFATPGLCGKWLDHFDPLENAGGGAVSGSMCLDNSTAYLAAWTGQPRWRETHSTGRFSRHRLHSALHEAFRTMFITGVTIVTLIFLLVLILAGVNRASEAARKLD